MYYTHTTNALLHMQPPFRLVGFGLLVWCTSALIAGFSRSFNSYSLLVAARMLSGVGEASFQVWQWEKGTWAHYEYILTA